MDRGERGDVKEIGRVRGREGEGERERRRGRGREGGGEGEGERETEREQGRGEESQRRIGREGKEGIHPPRRAPLRSLALASALGARHLNLFVCLPVFARARARV